jgi:hypothetical protein
MLLLPDQSGYLVRQSWTGFQDNESPIEKFVISLGSQEGFSDVFSNREVNGHTFSYTINGSRFNYCDFTSVAFFAIIKTSQ